MQERSIAAVLLLFLVLPATLYAQRCEDIVPEAMNLSGLYHTINVVPQQLRDQLRNEWEDESMELGQKDRMESAIASAFDSDRIRASVERDMIANCDPALMAEFLKKLQTPLAQRMMGLEADADSPEQKKQVERYVNAMRLQSPRESRVRLVDVLIEVMGNSDFLARVAVELSQELRTTALRMPPLKHGEAEEAMALMRARTQKNLESALLFTYRTASDAELRDYIDLYRSEAFYAFVTGSDDAMAKAFRAESHQLALEFKRLGVRPPKPAEPQPKPPEEKPKTAEKPK